MNAMLKSILSRRLRHIDKILGLLSCDHQKAELRTIKAGWSQWQCVRCGDAFGSILPFESSKTFDCSLKDRYLKTVEEFTTEFTVLKNQIRSQRHRDQYHAYLQTPEWRRKRSLVLARCNHTCEGCGENRAIHVHHKTYENVGNEFLFELIGFVKAATIEYTLK